MAEQVLKEKIRDVLRGGAFPGSDDYVYVSDGVDDNIHVVVVSPKFEGRGMFESQDAIFDELTKSMPWDEVSRVSLLIGVSPESLKSL